MTLYHSPDSKQNFAVSKLEISSISGNCKKSPSRTTWIPPNGSAFFLVNLAGESKILNGLQHIMETLSIIDTFICRHVLNKNLFFTTLSTMTEFFPLHKLIPLTALIVCTGRFLPLIWILVDKRTPEQPVVLVTWNEILFTPVLKCWTIVFVRKNFPAHPGSAIKRFWPWRNLSNTYC